MLKKLTRLFDALTLIGRYAADGPTRSALVAIYRSLSDRTKYQDEYDLTLRIGARGQGIRIRIRVEDIFVLNEMFLERQYKLSRPLPEGATIIDAGANVGLSALWFLSQCPDAKLHAFEPDRGNFGLLKANIGSQAAVTLWQKALGATDGQITLWTSEFGAMHSTVQCQDLMPNAQSYKVPQISLGSYLEASGIERVDLMKLDVEGAEIEVLKGLGNRLQRINVIVGEMHETLADEAEFYGMLTDAGFEIIARKEFHDSGAAKVHGFEAVQKRY